MRDPIPVISIIGRSGSGKTTLAERLIAALKSRGLKVGAIKHAPQGFDLDIEGKDSWRLHRAGADRVMLLSQEEVACYGSPPTGDLWDLICQFMGDLDLILAEGFTQKRFPKILVGKPEREMRDEEVILKVDDALKADVERICDSILPLIETERGSDIEVELTVDGRRVPLNRFTRRVMSNVIGGIVTALHGVERADKIVVRIRRSASPTLNDKKTVR